MTLQEFRRISLSGYVMNAEQDNFYFVSLSRHHPQRIQASRRLSKPAEPCSPGGLAEEPVQQSQAEDVAAETELCPDKDSVV